MSSELLDIKSAAALLSVDYSTMYQYVVRGDVRSVRLPSQRGQRGIIRIRCEDLDAFIEQYYRPHSGPVGSVSLRKQTPSEEGHQRRSKPEVPWYEKYA